MNRIKINYNKYLEELEVLLNEYKSKGLISKIDKMSSYYYVHLKTGDRIMCNLINECGISQAIKNLKSVLPYMDTVTLKLIQALYDTNKEQSPNFLNLQYFEKLENLSIKNQERLLEEVLFMKPIVKSLLMINKNIVEFTYEADYVNLQTYINFLDDEVFSKSLVIYEQVKPLITKLYFIGKIGE